jgi:hypothetical protein
LAWMVTGSFVPMRDSVRPRPDFHQAVNSYQNNAPACKTQLGVTSNVERCVQLAQQGGMDLANYMIHSFTFVPDKIGYIAVLHKVDGSQTQCVWHDVPQRLDNLLEREAPNGIRHVTVGANNSYVVVLNSGTVWWHGVPTSLHHLLADAEKKRLDVVVSITAVGRTDLSLDS